MRIALPLAALALLVAGPAARATEIVQDFPTPYAADPPTDQSVFDLKLFDPTLGTLDSVTLNLTGYVTEQGAVITNNTSAKKDGTAMVKVMFHLDNAEIQSILNGLEPVVTASEPYTLAGGRGHSTMTVDDPEIWNTPVSVNTTMPDYLAYLADFIATPGQTALSITETDPLREQMGADVTMGSFASSDFSVTYDYTPISVPVSEPASMMLLGFGLLALTAGRRFRLI